MNIKIISKYLLCLFIIPFILLGILNISKNDNQTNDEHLLNKEESKLTNSNSEFDGINRVEYVGSKEANLWSDSAYLKVFFTDDSLDGSLNSNMNGLPIPDTYNLSLFINDDTEAFISYHYTSPPGVYSFFTVKGLTAETEYRNCIFKMFEEDGVTEIGEEYDVGNVTTPSKAKPTGFNIIFRTIEIKEIYSDGFDIWEKLSFERNQFEDYWPFTFKVNSKEGEIFTLNTEIDPETIEVRGLTPGSAFHNVKLSVWCDGEKIDTSRDLGTISLPDTPFTPIIEGVGDISNITQTGFESLVFIGKDESSFLGKNLNGLEAPYRIEFFANGDYENALWTSKVMYEVGPIHIVVDGLTESTNYNNIHFRLVDTDLHRLPLEDYTNVDDFTTLKKDQNLPLIISLSIVGGIIAIVVIALIILFFLRKRNDGFKKGNFDEGDFQKKKPIKEKKQKVKKDKHNNDLIKGVHF